MHVYVCASDLVTPSCTLTFLVQDKNNAALILKINLETMEVCVDDFLEDVDIDEVSCCGAIHRPAVHLSHCCVLLLTQDTLLTYVG